MARAPLTLILNDDAIPAPDLIERHLETHRSAGPKTAVLGTFHFDDASLESPFVQVLDTSDLVFAFRDLRPNTRYGWTHFWTCNLSLATDAILEVGGFDDQRFDRPICEDVELGYRLQKRGWSVLYREECRAWHAHELSPADFADRAFILGIYQERFAQKHDMVSTYFGKTPLSGEYTKEVAIEQVTMLQSGVQGAMEKLNALNAEYRGRRVTPDVAQAIEDAARSVSIPIWIAGVVKERFGVDVRTSSPAAAAALA